MTRASHLLLLGLSILLASSGCHRQFYRKQADCEANALLLEKAHDVARPPNIPLQIDVDPRSRMFNPFDLDFQPMPLDDPASYRYMQCVDGRRGYPLWEGAGVTNTAENPDWWQFLPLDDDGVLVLNSENAVRIALLHSPDYQQQLEALYLSALDVTAQRFQFETQFFGTLTTQALLRENSKTVGLGNSSRFGQNRLTMNRSFATGADLAVNLANNVVWELSGSSTRTANTILDFSLLQPLLRTAGRDVVLENLTQSERTLLANVRAFERFRRTFFLQVTTGRGLEIGSAGIVRVNTGVLGGAGGYIGLLQRQLRIRNSEENIARQTENLLLTEDNLVEMLTKIPDDAGEIVNERIQVAQARQRLLSSQTSLVNQQRDYQRTLDVFMRTLGLPPYICAKLNDPILDRFELIDRSLLKRREELGVVRSNVGQINVRMLELGETTTDPVTGLPETRVEWTPELQGLVASLRDELKPMSDFNQILLDTDLPMIAADIEVFRESLPQRRIQNAELKELYESERGSICALLGIETIDESIFNLEELSELEGQLQSDFDNLKNDLQGYQSRIDALTKTLDDLVNDGPKDEDSREIAVDLRDNVILFSQDLLADLGDDVLEIQLIQAAARTESVLLPEVDLDPATGFEIARKNRRDWANARAALVDSWRQIEVSADDLESSLDLEFSGELQNTSGNPIPDDTTGNIRVGLRWDAPITRLLERNDYRRTLIQYEQTRRRYYQFEDDIWQLLRAEIRQLQANQFNFELGRQAVRIAADQIELNADRRSLDEARGRAAGPTAARDAIDALTDLLNAQNGLLDLFVNYEVTRRALDLDLGTMELTPEGLWIDPGAISPEGLLDLPGTTSDGMIECGCNQCGFRYNPLPPEPIFLDMAAEARARQAEAAAEAMPSVMPESGESEVVPEMLPPGTGEEAGDVIPSIESPGAIERLPSPTSPSDITPPAEEAPDVILPPQPEPISAVQRVPTSRPKPRRLPPTS